MKLSRLIALLTLFILGAANSASACSACWGDTSGSKSSHAAAIGIGAMVALMLIVLGAIAGFGWHLVQRAKHPLPDYDELLSEDHTPDDTEPKA
jgi:hypothetical protein